MIAGLSLGFAMACAGGALAQDDTSGAMQEGGQTVQVVMQTSMGTIKLELDVEKAPITTANFISYVEKGHYDGTTFHRVIPGFMIQGGGFTPDMQQKPTDPPIKNEWQNGLKNLRGTIAMARTQVHDSATSQFFINVVDNAGLDMPRDGAAYAVFGRVIEGMEVVDQIKDVPTTTKGGHRDVPVTPVIIEKATWSGPMTLEQLKAKAAEGATRARREAIEYAKSLGVDPDKGVQSESGLWYADLAVGEGAQPLRTSTVRVHYTGWLPNGTKFDSSRDRGQPAEFPLTGVIKGWTEGVSGMKVGGKRVLVVPPELGYGSRGAGGVIPPNATLVFEVELLDVVK